jgi:hypothetical protein
MTRWLRESENSGINHPRGTSRMSSLEIPTPGMTVTAARSCTSCTAGAGNSPLAGTLSPYAVRSCRQLQGSRRLPHINDGGAPPSPSWHPTAPDNMAGAGILPLITAPVIANMRLHHVLIDGGAGLNVMSHAAFRQLQIPGSRLGPSRPFSGVGPQPVYPLGSIALPVTFGTEENFHMENIVFDVPEVNLPFNAIIDRPALYRFMAIAHYGYFVLKMPSPIGVLTVQGDRAAALEAVEKLHALAAETACPDDGGRNPSTSGTKAPPRRQRYNQPERMVSPSKPSGSLRIPPRPPALRVIWTRNRNSHSSPSSRQMPTCSHGSRHRCLGSPGR